MLKLRNSYQYKCVVSFFELVDHATIITRKERQSMQVAKLKQHGGIDSDILN